MKKLPAYRAHAAAVKDIEVQVARLMGKRFVAATPFERLQHYPRYLKAAALRLDKLKSDPGLRFAPDGRIRPQGRIRTAPASWPGRGRRESGAVPLAAGGVARRCSCRN